MFQRISSTSLLLILSIFASSQATATLILEQYGSDTATPDTIGGYAMTDFDIVNGSLGSSYGTATTASANSPISGTLQFLDRQGNAAQMTRRLADSETNWWVNGENFDYDVFSTSKSFIEILLPENTRAFSFNVGADLRSRNGNNAWLSAASANDTGVDRTYFRVNRTNTPGFGIYTDNSDGNCSALTSVIIDPLLWGFGNFSINQDSCATSVPAPAPIALLALGLLGLGAMRKRSTS